MSHPGIPNFLPFADNQTGIELGSTVGSSLLTCGSEHVTSDENATISVVWIRNGQTITAGDEHKLDTMTQFGTVTSSLEITSFAQSDVGEYQCLFIDSDSEAEVITTIPLKLNTGE